MTNMEFICPGNQLDIFTLLLLSHDCFTSSDVSQVRPKCHCFSHLLPVLKDPCRLRLVSCSTLRSSSSSLYVLFAVSSPPTLLWMPRRSKQNGVCVSVAALRQSVDIVAHVWFPRLKEIIRRGMGRGALTSHHHMGEIHRIREGLEGCIETCWC